MKVKQKLKQINLVLNGKNFNLTTDDMSITSTNFNVDKNGNMTCNNGTFKGTINAGSTIIGSVIKGSSFIAGDNDEFYVNNIGACFAKDLHLKNKPNAVCATITSTDTSDTCNIGMTNKTIFLASTNLGSKKVSLSVDNTRGHIYCYGTIEACGDLGNVNCDGYVSATNFVNTSEENLKTNILKLKDEIKNGTIQKSALNIIKDAEICEFNYINKPEKTIGFVIGKDYKTPKEVIKTQIKEDGKQVKGIDLYSMVSLSWKAIQEILLKMESLEKEEVV